MKLDRSKILFLVFGILFSFLIIDGDASVMETEVIPLPHEAHSMPAPKMAYNAAHLKARAKETHAKKMKKMAPKKGHKKMVPKKAHKGKRSSGRSLLAHDPAHLGGASTGIPHFHKLIATNKECYSDDFDVFSGVATREECELKSCAGKSGYDYNEVSMVCRVFNGALGAIDVVHTHVQDTVCYEQIVNPAIRQRCTLVESTEYTFNGCGDGSSLEHGEICEVTCMYGKYAVGRLQCSDGVMSGTPTCRANNDGASSHTITFSDTLEFKSNGQICVDISLQNMDTTSLVQIGVQNVLDSDSAAELVSNSQFYEGHVGHCSNYDSAAGVLYPALKLLKDDAKKMLTTGRSASGDLVEGGCAGDNFLGLNGRDTRFTRLSCSSTGNGKYDAVVKFCNTLDTAEACAGIGTSSTLTERREQTPTTDRTYFTEKVCVGVNSWERGDGTTDIVKQSSCTTMAFYLDHKHGGFVDSSTKTLDIDYGCELKIRDTRQQYRETSAQVDGADLEYKQETNLEVTYSLHCPKAQDTSTGGVKFVSAQMDNSLLNTAVVTAKSLGGAVTDVGPGDGEVIAVPPLVASGDNEIILTVTTDWIAHGVGDNKDPQELITAFGTAWGMVVTFQREDCTATGNAPCETKDRYYAISNSRTSSPIYTSVTSVDGMQMRLYKNAFPYWSDPLNYDRANLYSWTQKQLFGPGDQIVTGDTLTIVQQVATVVPHSTAHIDRVIMFTDAEQCPFELDQYPHGNSNGGRRCHPLYDAIFDDDNKWNEARALTMSHREFTKMRMEAADVEAFLLDYFETQCTGTPTAKCPCSTHIISGHLNRMGRCKKQFVEFYKAVDIHKDGISLIDTHAQTTLLSNELRAECIEEKQLQGCAAGDKVLVLKNGIKGKEHCIPSDMAFTAHEMVAKYRGVTRVTKDDVHRIACMRQNNNLLPQSVGDTYDAKCANDRAPLLAEVVIGAGVMQSYRARRVRFYVTTRIVNEFADDCAQFRSGGSNYDTGGLFANNARRLLSAPEKKKKPQGRKLLNTNYMCTEYCAGDKACCESPDMHKDGLVVCKWDPATTAGCVTNTIPTPAPPPPPASTTTGGSTGGVDVAGATPAAGPPKTRAIQNVQVLTHSDEANVEVKFHLKANGEKSDLVKAMEKGVLDAIGANTPGSNTYGKVEAKVTFNKQASPKEFYVDVEFSATNADISLMISNDDTFTMAGLTPTNMHTVTSTMQGAITPFTSLAGFSYKDVVFMSLYAKHKKCTSVGGTETVVPSWNSLYGHMGLPEQLQQCKHECCANCNGISFSPGSCTLLGDTGKILAWPSNEQDSECWFRSNPHVTGPNSKPCKQEDLPSKSGISTAQCDYSTKDGGKCIPSCPLGKTPVGHYTCRNGSWKDGEPGEAKVSCRNSGARKKPQITSGKPILKPLGETSVKLCIPVNITDLPNNAMLQADWRNALDDDHYPVATLNGGIYEGNNLCSNYGGDNGEWYPTLRKTENEFEEILRTGLDWQGHSQSGNCKAAQHHYLTPFPRDATTASSEHFRQDYCHFDNVADTTDRDVLICRTLTQLENCPGTSGGSALTETKISEIKSDAIERHEYSTKLCLSTVTDVPTEHEEKNIEQSTHCQTLEFTHNTKVHKWTMKETVDYMCELKATKQHPVQHGTDADGDAAASMKQELELHCPTRGGDTEIIMTNVEAINAALGATVSFDCPGTNAQDKACKLIVETMKVKKGASHNPQLFNEAFGAIDGVIDFSLRITTNNGVTDTTIDYLSTTSQLLPEEKVYVKESKLAVQIFGDTSTGGATHVDQLNAQAIAAHKPATKQLGSGNEFMMQLTMSDLAPKTASIVWNAAVFVVTDHPLYAILKNGNEDAWKAFMALTTGYKNQAMFGLSEALFKSITTDYWAANCEQFKSTCPCKTAADLKKNSQCYKNFINGVHYVDLVKDGVLQSHDESKMKVQQNSATCLESKPLDGCDAGTSGNVIAPKDSADCHQGYVVDTSVHAAATKDGDDMGSTDAVMRRACKIAKGAALGTQSAFAASSKCQADTKTVVEFSAGADSIASLLKFVETLNPAVANDRMIHIRVEIKNVNYYTHGCDGRLASSSRRLLNADPTSAVSIVTSQATKVDNALVQLQTDLARVNDQIAVPKDSYDSATAQIAYGSATATIATLKANIDDLKASASADAHMVNTLTTEKNTAVTAKNLADTKLATEKERTSGKTTHELEPGVIIALVVLGVLVLGLGIALCYMMRPSTQPPPAGPSEVEMVKNPAQYRPLFRQTVDL